MPDLTLCDAGHLACAYESTTRFKDLLNDVLEGRQPDECTALLSRMSEDVQILGAIFYLLRTALLKRLLTTNMIEEYMELAQGATVRVCSLAQRIKARTAAQQPRACSPEAASTVDSFLA